MKWAKTIRFSAIKGLELLAFGLALVYLTIALLVWSLKGFPTKPRP